MPRENRKRGKKNKTKAEDTFVPDIVPPRPEPKNAQQQQPSWMVSAPDQNEINLEAPFGYVDADIKAYFRTVDIQLKEWQEKEGGQDSDANPDMDPNEAKRMFFVAALSEMQGKEKELATDPDCSLIVERMAYSMDDFVRRIFIDSLVGSYEQLVKHRFASHVCQTLFTVAADTVSRECRGILPSMPDSEEGGELRTLTHLILDVCKELLPSTSALILDPFGSHVIRSLLLLLSPTLAASDVSQSNVRSKKSTAWKARQGPLKSVFKEGTTEPTAVKSTPKKFRSIAAKFVQAVRSELSDNEVRALGANPVACPVLQMLLEVEAEQGLSDRPDSLMDRILVGIITACHNDAPTPEPSDYLNTLLRDPTSSHLLETLITRAPDAAFGMMWSTYFQGKLARLAGHPVANFVLAKAIWRVDSEQMRQACQELEGAWGKIIKAARTGVLRAMIDRAAEIHSHEKVIGEAVLAAFELETEEDHKLLVPCCLALKSLQEYKTALGNRPSAPGEAFQGPNSRRPPHMDDPLEPKTQGAVLLQSLLRMADPHNGVVLNSINSLSMDEVLVMSKNSTSSRVLDVVLESPAVPFKTKREFVKFFIGHYHTLVDDRIGSRVGDRCWAFSDPFLREQIAKSLISYEQNLAASFYGKFFARNLYLYLLQRKPQEWRNMQADRKLIAQGKQPAAAPKPWEKSAAAAPPPTEKKRKRENTEDEIDALFNANLGKKSKADAVPAKMDVDAEDVEQPTVEVDEKPKDKGLEDVLGAIKAAPSGPGEKKRKKKKD